MDIFHLQRIDRSLALIAHDVGTILKKLEHLTMTQQELLAELTDVKAKLVTGIAALQAAIAKQTDVIPELKAAGDDLEAIANALTPVTPPAPAP